MGSKKRIAIVSSLMFGTTGVGITTMNIARILLAHGHDIFFISSTPPAFSHPNYHPITVKPRICLKSIQWSIGNRMNFRLLHQYATPSDIDIVKFASSLPHIFSHLIKFNNIDTAIFTESFLEYIYCDSKATCKFLVNFGCPRYMFQKLGLSNEPVNKYLYDKDVSFIKRVDKFRSPSAAMSSLAADYYNIEMNSIKVIPNPIDTSLFYPAQTSKDLDSIGLCFSGRFSREKGADSIIEIIPPLMKEFKNLFLSIAGSDSIDSLGRSRIELLKNSLSDLGCLERFHWAPSLNYYEMPDFYRKHAIFLSPSLFESFGNTLAEAQACGLPVISCRSGGIPEVVIDKTTGFLENFSDNKSLSDKLRELITQQGLRKQMSRAAYLWISNSCSFSSVSNKYNNLLID